MPFDNDRCRQVGLHALKISGMIKCDYLRIAMIVGVFRKWMRMHNQCPVYDMGVREQRYPGMVRQEHYQEDNRQIYASF